MSFDATNLTPIDTTDSGWARAWTRFMLRDTEEPEQYSDDELDAVLAARSVDLEDNDGNEATYYRPHEAAAYLIETDPERAITESLLAWSGTRRDPRAVASAIRAQNEWVDDAIAEAADQYPNRGGTLEAVF